MAEKEEQTIADVLEESLGSSTTEQPLSSTDLEHVAVLMANFESGRNTATLHVLVTLMVKKIITPKQDIRYHKKSMEGGFSGRKLDSVFITPFLREHGLTERPSSGWQTHSLQESHPYDKRYPGGISPDNLKVAFLSLADSIQTKKGFARRILSVILAKLVETRDHKGSGSQAGPESDTAAPADAPDEESPEQPAVSSARVDKVFEAYQRLISEFGEVGDHEFSLANRTNKQSIRLIDEKHMAVVMENFESGRNTAALHVLATLLTKKIISPEQDIRCHKRSMNGGFPGRVMDRVFITPFLLEHNLTERPSSGWETHSLQENHPYDENYPGTIAPDDLKTAFLSLVDRIQTKEDFARQMVSTILTNLVEIRDRDETPGPAPAEEPLEKGTPEKPAASAGAGDREEERDGGESPAQEQAKAPAKKRGRRKKAASAAAVDREEERVGDESPAQEQAKAPAKKRGRRKKAASARAEDRKEERVGDESPAQEQPKAPAKKRGRRKKAASAAAAGREEERVGDESPAQEQAKAPAKKRGRRKKAASAAAAGREEERVGDESPAPEQAKAPARKRGGRKKAASAAAAGREEERAGDESPEPEQAKAPARKRRGRKAAASAGAGEREEERNSEESSAPGQVETPARKRGRRKAPASVRAGDRVEEPEGVESPAPEQVETPEEEGIPGEPAASVQAGEPEEEGDGGESPAPEQVETPEEEGVPGEPAASVQAGEPEGERDGVESPVPEQVDMTEEEGVHGEPAASDEAGEPEEEPDGGESPAPEEVEMPEEERDERLPSEPERIEIPKEKQVRKKSFALVRPKNKTVEAVVALVKELWAQPGASRVPVLAVFAVYQCLVKEVGRYRNHELTLRQSGTSPDHRDDRPVVIALFREGHPVESVEVQHGIEIEAAVVEQTIEEIKRTTVRRHYILGTNGHLGEMERIRELVADARVNHGFEVIVDGVARTLECYLRLVKDTDHFIGNFVELLETDNGISSDLKRAWDAIQ